jgi:hypothetical protein
MAIDFKALGNKAAETGANMTVAQQGGGDYTPPAEGFCLLRLVSYVELGKQRGTFKGVPNVKDKVQIVFEVSGPKHPPEERDGVKYPHRIGIEENLSLNEKARFFKLFRVMNYKGDAQHMVQLLGDPFKGRIVHRKFKGKDGKERIVAELYDKELGAYTIAPPRVDVVDPDTQMPTGEVRVVNVPPALTPLKGFVWSLADKEQWDSLFIEGEYPERKNDKGEVTAPAKSKNVLQNTIKAATNFKGSPIYTVLAQAGVPLDLTEAEVPVREEEEDGESDVAAQANAAIAKAAATPTGADADDALNGVI